MDAKSMQTIVGHLDSVICGDNATVMSTFPDACIDLVVTSPPYDDLRKYGGHSWDFPAVARELTRILKPGGVIVWVVGDATVDGSETLTSMRQAIHFRDVCGLSVETMIYRKKGAPSTGSNRRYIQCWEFMFILSNGEPSTANLLRDRENRHWNTTGKYETRVKKRRRTGEHEQNTRKIAKRFGRRMNVWEYSPIEIRWEAISKGIEHPAMFPLSLAVDHVLTWSNPGDVILDPFAGSGTTLKAANQHGRSYIGIDVNPSYVEICRKRVAQGVLPFVHNKQKMEAF
jgi:site-specific DNA-methyltransferase (adenine-specific)